MKSVGRDEVLAALERCLHGGEAPRKVLVIDDDPRALSLMRAVLEPEGCEVLTATGGEDGVALAESERPDVVLLDLLMPGMDGFAVVDRLRAEVTTAEIPIVVLTSKTMTAEDKRRLNGEISYLAQKSEFDRGSLIRLVERLGRAPAAR